FRRVVPTNYNPKGERFLIASRFPTPPLTYEFFSPGATVTDGWVLVNRVVAQFQKSVCAWMIIFEAAYRVLKGALRRRYDVRRGLHVTKQVKALALGVV
nr:hypothetical protein [Tanacetum cinerariifolium]